ncbi:MAG TPA: LysM peptidoglycan-binding domain-containing protein [Polyangiaceae bacterium]|nr:LysM peptidoglycan-binding domain-containing protein [Polyangiaceae bacterium]
MSVLRAVFASLLVLGSVHTASAASSPRYHTVAAGQRLGSIAKRYGVNVDAICTANGIERNQRLKVGEKLLVPGKDDKDGTLTRRQYGPPEGKAARDGATAETLLASTREPARPSTHRVYAGQRLETIAKRYQVSIEALCEANRIHRHDKLKPGQVLVIPGSLPDGGLSRVDDDDDRHGSKPTKKGYIDMSTYTTRYRGVVFDRKGKIAPGTVEAISRLFAATGSRPRVDARLIALLADVSEHFGGRPMRVVSGWRDHSYFEDSRHKHSQAVDFSIPGVANTVLRDYVRRFRNCGVGYYPNSSFVHLDVRESAAYWVDYAGPGEAPRGKPRAEATERLAESDSSGPIEEAGGDVDDRPQGAPGGATQKPADVTSAATKVVPENP